MATQLKPPTASNDMFKSAANLLITGGTFTAAQNNVSPKADRTDLWKLLRSKVSWNAILNEAGRGDPVRCYPGTREAVMTHIENWIGGADATQRIFWLSGPAGAGKSAITQSIAERCLDRGVSSASFFFFRVDPTRNHAAPLVATFLHQLVDICPAIKRRVHDFISENLFIFDISVEQQIKALMFTALLHSGRAWPVKHKILLILDGLDECSSESNSWGVQQDILRALHYIVTQKESPFILLISSRAEPHLTMVFNGIQSQVGRLYLDGESFSSSEDIRRFVTGELEEIKTMHHLSRTVPAGWPAPDIIDSIVRKSSGHFIYAATIMRFIQISLESPVLSLEKVEGIRPVDTDAPFAQLDAVYSHILGKAKKWVKARDILAAQTLPDPHDGSRSLTFYQANAPRRSAVLLDALGYNLSEIASYTAELTALVKVDSVHKEVKFYHSSFGDFLLDKARSGEFFIDLDEFRLKLVPALFYCADGVKDHVSWSLVLEHFTSLTMTNDVLTQALSTYPLLSSGLAFTGPTLRLFLLKIQELYAETDARNYKTILKRWLTWFHKNHGTVHDNQLDGIKHGGEMWNDLAQALTVKSKNTKGRPNTPDQAVPPANGSSLSFAAESVISDMLMAHTQSIKQEQRTDTIPEAGVADAAQELSGGFTSSNWPKGSNTTLKWGDTQAVREINPDGTQIGLGQGFSPIDEDLEDLKAGVVNLVEEPERLARETKRADAAEREAREVLALCKTLEAAKGKIELDFLRAKEELGLYKIQLDSVQKDIYRAQEIIDRGDRQRENAEDEIQRLSSELRKLQEERAVAQAQKEGRRLGYKEGLRLGRVAMQRYERRDGSDDGGDYEGDAQRIGVPRRQQVGLPSRITNPPVYFRAEGPQSRHEDQMEHGLHDQQESLADLHRRAQSNISQEFVLYLSCIDPTNPKIQPIPAAQREDTLPFHNTFTPQPQLDDNEDAQQDSTGAHLMVQAGGAPNLAEAQVLQDAYAEAIGSASARELFAIRTEAEAAIKEGAAVRAELSSACLSLEAAYAEAHSVLDSAKKGAQSIREENNRVAMSGWRDVFTARDEYKTLLAKHDAVLTDMKTAQLQTQKAKAKAEAVREEIIIAQEALSSIHVQIHNLAPSEFSPTQFYRHFGEISATDHGWIFL